ncbi:membrane-associated, eicosanoid/glutathione metabolism protein [Daldinia decipiens]|uniref:membrane-associated, eicosanoid/glutathione metabolism protein n=1 Tax=Daldinia decipiens TaxID=326647 RepID=UPI0020C5591B|nr:membrane-associated, eicosanoid/glutathione metabolism protein [Daldinia decipiens]KAI1659540.1 membrane-associated, eicosanoid/glutathione metabolism protein [Daldinia decipiens]
MSSIIGITTPALAPLLPVTGTFAMPFSAYFAFLSCRVVYHRLKDQFYVGDNSSKNGDPNNKLYLASRCHQNFIENVPMALIIAAFAELNGANQRTLSNALTALLTFRVLHVELGLINGLGLGRPIGYWGTMATTLWLGGYAAYLVKGYWGF